MGRQKKMRINGGCVFSFWPRPRQQRETAYKAWKPESEGSCVWIARQLASSPFTPLSGKAQANQAWTSFVENVDCAARDPNQREPALVSVAWLDLSKIKKLNMYLQVVKDYIYLTPVFKATVVALNNGDKRCLKTCFMRCLKTYFTF